MRPNTGLSANEEERSELMHKYGKVSAKEAEVGWRKQYESTRDQCIHGSGCKLGPGNCKSKKEEYYYFIIMCVSVGSRITEVHLLNGGLIPIWSALESTLLKRAESLDLGYNSIIFSSSQKSNSLSNVAKMNAPFASFDSYWTQANDSSECDTRIS